MITGDSRARDRHIKKARKDHECSKCQRTIKAGQSLTRRMLTIYPTGFVEEPEFYNLILCQDCTGKNDAGI